MKTTQTILIALILVLFCRLSYGQSGSQGSTYIHHGVEMAVFGEHNFSTGGMISSGVVYTDRDANHGFLSFTQNAYASGASDDAHLDGYAKDYKTGSFIFPIGDEGVYAPAMVSTSSSTSPTDAAYYRQHPTDGGYDINEKQDGIVSIDEFGYWDINGNTPSQITLSWRPEDNLSSSELQHLIIVGWNGSQWEEVPSAYDATDQIREGGETSTQNSGTITSTGNVTPNSYEVYTIASKDPTLVLPIFLYDYTAQLNDNGTVSLDWTSLVEINNDHYTIYKSNDMENWEWLSDVEGAGNSSEKLYYNLIDPNPYLGVSYYRLTQTDYDGIFSELGVRSVQVNDKSLLMNNQLSVYPNPTHQWIMIESSQELDGIMPKVLSSVGVDVTSHTEILARQSNKIQIDMSVLAPGIYMVYVGKSVVKVVRQ